MSGAPCNNTSGIATLMALSGGWSPGKADKAATRVPGCHWSALAAISDPAPSCCDEQRA